MSIPQKVLRYEINPAFLDMTESEIYEYFNSRTFRAIYLANGNFIFDSVCTIKLQEGFKDVEVAIQDGSRMRDKDCNQIAIFSDNNEEVFNIYYKPSEFIKEYGTININLKSFHKEEREDGHVRF